MPLSAGLCVKLRLEYPGAPGDARG